MAHGLVVDVAGAVLEPQSLLMVPVRPAATGGDRAMPGPASNPFRRSPGCFQETLLRRTLNGAKRKRPPAERQPTGRGDGAPSRPPSQDQAALSGPPLSPGRGNAEPAGPPAFFVGDAAGTLMPPARAAHAGERIAATRRSGPTTIHAGIRASLTRTATLQRGIREPTLPTRIPTRPTFASLGSP